MTMTTAMYVVPPIMLGGRVGRIGRYSRSFSIESLSTHETLNRVLCVLRVLAGPRPRVPLPRPHSPRFNPGTRDLKSRGLRA